MFRGSFSRYSITILSTQIFLSSYRNDVWRRSFGIWILLRPDAYDIFKMNSCMTLTPFELFSYCSIEADGPLHRWQISLSLSLFCTQTHTNTHTHTYMQPGMHLDRSIMYLSCLRLAAAVQYSWRYYNGKILFRSAQAHEY